MCIRDSYRDGSLTALSNHLNYEFTWLSKTILKLSGYTYTDLVQKKRLEQACFLLRTTALDVYKRQCDSLKLIRLHRQHFYQNLSRFFYGMHQSEGQIKILSCCNIP